MGATAPLHYYYCSRHLDTLVPVRSSRPISGTNLGRNQRGLIVATPFPCHRLSSPAFPRHSSRFHDRLSFGPVLERSCCPTLNRIHASSAARSALHPGLLPRCLSPDAELSKVEVDNISARPAQSDVRTNSTDRASLPIVPPGSCRQDTMAEATAPTQPPATAAPDASASSSSAPDASSAAPEAGKKQPMTVLVIGMAGSVS